MRNYEELFSHLIKCSVFAFCIKLKAQNTVDEPPPFRIDALQPIKCACFDDWVFPHSCFILSALPFRNLTATPITSPSVLWCADVVDVGVS